MIDFIEYVVSELKSRRLSKENALHLIRQFADRGGAAGAGPVLHPLVQRNVSDLHRQCYCASFDGNEFFLRDHQVLAEGSALRVLPGVAYLEMARAALADALRASADEPVELSDVVWLKPLVVSGRKDVFIALGADGPQAERVEFEIFSAAESGEEEVVHCRGLARLAAAETPSALDLRALSARCARGALDAERIYPAYREMGMQFGPAHRAVRRLARGEGEVLAELGLPAAAGDTLPALPLHPSLMDGALQASLGLLEDIANLPDRPSLPFALESLRLFAACPREPVAWIRHASDSQPARGLSKLDIDLCDAEGRVCVQLRGFSSRRLNAPAATETSRPGETGLTLARPVWRAEPLSALATSTASRHHLLYWNLPGVTLARLHELAPDLRPHKLAMPSGDVAERYAAAALSCFEALRKILAEAGDAPAFVQLVLREEEAEADLLEGLSGLLQSAALENPRVRAQLLVADAHSVAGDLPRHLRAEAGAAQPRVRYRGDRREVLTWEECPAQAEAPVAYRENGVYLITGGLGGLGRLFAADILDRCAHARVVLTGRADVDSAQDKLRDLAATPGAGERLSYRPLELGDADAVRALIEALVVEHGRLDGILHAAGMIADGLLGGKTAETFADVLAPKVRGTFNLDLASRELDLDFLMLFSSGAAVMGNAGQADYAAANGFLDRFAAHRERLVAAGERRGRTVSINWPLWRDGGMQMPQHAQRAMFEATGMLPLATGHGLAAFHACLHAPQIQTVVIEGELTRIRRALFDAPAPDLPPPVAAARPASAPAPVSAPASALLSAPPAAPLAELTRDYLRQQFAALFKLPPAKVDPRAPLEKYGIDSILAMDLTRQLEKHFGPLSKTLFFEHQTIDELTAYFLDAHAATLATLLTPSSVSAATPASAATPPVPAPRIPSRHERGAPRRGATPAAPAMRGNEPIAIVGLAGRYPEAEDIEAFWANLRDGRDCIVEVPRERWDWRDYYSEDRSREGAHYSKWGGFIRGIDEFDPLFFNIPPVEAGMLDPQERLFLQHAWMAIEDAGLTRASLQIPDGQGLPGQVGVYVGVMYGEYQLFGAEASLRGRRIGVPVSYASIANRVSYFMNLHGPSMTLDSMCSSSLTAIHLACEDLRQGRTALALAGGVNLSLHPNKYLILSAGQYISGDGHCQSFGEGGDGYIPGEGVGVVALKRLADAERDGNHIYGLIRGSALNHGGKTNGYSVPNPKAQAAVIAMALRAAGIEDARALSYVEAHGTGTRLGDPIEIAALSQVFRQTTEAHQFCAIGSAKSNIGHCESAAGIAGLTKVLLQMKHAMLVPSLHSARLNPHIDFEASPFVVNQALRPWPRPVVEGRELPRLAGISSFGAGGSNAHLIIEEYRAETPREHSAGPALVPLSARTAAQLRQRAEDLARFLRRHEDLDLQSVAYTLQLGREAMDHRLALVVDSPAALAEALEAFLRGEPELARCHVGRVDPDGDGVSALGEDEDMAETIGRWIARGKLSKLAELWVRGLTIDWRQLHAGHRPALTSLPTYPFARDRHWLPVTTPDRARGAQASVLHPLVQLNVSDFYQQRYLSEFRGDEFFLADHRVGGGADSRALLPAVAYLEMVRAAVELALPGQSAGRRLEIRHVAWARPLVVQGPCRVALTLDSADGETVAFEVRGEASAEDPADEAPLHCQGEARLTSSVAAEQLDLAALRAAMSGGTIAADAVYEATTRMGLHYGPSFRCLRAIHRGTDQVLAELALADDAADERYGLHPGLLDSALQAALGLVADPGALPEAPSVPFSLDSIVIDAEPAPRMFAWLRTSAGSGEAVRKLDIDLCDEQGRVRVRLAGLALRALRPAEGTTEERETGMLIARPRWERVGEASTPFAAAHREVLLLGLSAFDAVALHAALPACEVDVVSLSGATGADERYRIAALACFERLRGLFEAGVPESALFQVVIADEGDDALLAGLSGLIDTARLENPRMVGQLILTARDVAPDALAAQLETARRHPAHSQLKFEGPAPSVPRWDTETSEEEDDEKDDEGSEDGAFRAGGVYLITGGLGGLGRLFVREIFARAADASVIVTGRAPLDADRRVALEALSTELAVPASRLVYRQLDLQREEEVEALVAGVVAQFGGLHGVLHSAGAIDDHYILGKRSEAFVEVLAPKVRGTVNIDLATQRVELDFLVLFSSLASALGNAGQADYAAANGFMDRFAAHRNARVRAGERHGRTLSILWPLWEEGGMRLADETVAMLREVSGMTPLRTASGMRAFHRGLSLDADRVLVVEGDPARLRKVLREGRTVPASASAPAPITGDEARLTMLAERFLIDEFAALMHVPAHEVELRAPLEKYGMDSVLAMKLTAQLERSFGSLSKTLFFEYQNIASLAAYLAKAFPATVLALSGQSPPAASMAPTPVAVPPRMPAVAHGKLRPAAPAPAASDEIAIVGVAGRYPQAPDLDAFWRNLAAGRDCIREIPAERWDHAALFHPARNQPGKAYSKWGGFLDGADLFDALFFNISPKEAELIDPQERLFLETAWETLEDAGYAKDALAGRRVGVYVGVMWGQYELYGVGAGGAGMPSSSFASVANRVSYFFDFHGPSLAVDTMCSSSLTAIQLACEALRQGSVEVALAGGVNLSLHPAKYLSLSQGNFASTDGRCRSFGEGGDGYVPGEGVGAVLLKPLRRALADGDRVYALIKGGAINHGGKTNGYTVPNPVAQGELIREVLDRAGIDPASIDYVETHGTGTALGDPIEVTGLVRAFEAAARAPLTAQSCAIGSVKSGIGHLESAAGIAALTKVLLQMKHGMLAPSLHAERLNPHIDFAATPFRVQRELAPWPARPDRPRRAAISSFGAGGANAHLIVEQYLVAPVTRTQRPELFLLSARSRQALRVYAERMVDFLAGSSVPALADIAFTSQLGRTAMPARLALLADDTVALREALARWLAEAASAPVAGDDRFEGHAREGGAQAASITAGPLPSQDELRRHELSRLARLWVSGAQIDWASLHASGDARRVSLPTYPFMRERYWIAAPALPIAAPAPERLPETETLYFRPEWQDAPLRGGGQAPARLLLIDADEGIADTLAQALPRTAITRVGFGEAYCRLDAGHYRVDSSAAAFASLIEDMDRGAEGGLPDAILIVSSAREATGAQLEHGVHALHALCRALCRALLTPKAGGRVRILALQGGAHTAPVASAALHEALAGYCRSLSLEHPGFGWKVLSLRDGDFDVETIVRRAAEELTEANWSDGELRRVAGQGRQRKEIRRCAPAVVESARARPATIRQGGCYILTGGLGGLGLLFGRLLASEYGARLVLSGRSALDAALQARLAALQAVARQTADIVYVQADVADAAQAQSLVDEARRRFGRIDGVIHSAGLTRDSFVLHKSRDEMEAVFAAKIHGCLNLDHATRDADLDLFLSFSSVAGVLGNVGQADYAYANAFLDAFAARRAELVAVGLRSGRSLSIAWPLWQEGGMRLAAEEVELLARRTGLRPLPTEAGLLAWDILLRGEDSQGMVLHGDDARIAAYLAPKAAAPVPAAPYDADAGDGEALRIAAESYLKRLLGEEIKLSVERIDAQERFESYGLDSMMIGRINARLEQDFGELPKTLFYQYASIEELAGYFVREARTGLRRVLGEAMPETPEPASAAEAPRAMPELVEAVRTQAEVVIPRFDAHGERVAIVGIHGRFPGGDPGADSLADFWRHLRAGNDLIEQVPAERWDAAAFFDADPEAAKHGRIYCKWGGFLEQADAFDAAFFGIAPEEARMIDPQERLFIQSVWSAMEDAGYTRDSLRQRHPKGRSADVGVFVGVTSNTYHLLAPEAWSRGESVAPGSLPWSIANRVSYFFDFQGPSLPVDTACSSSLVAIHMASQSLLRGECQVAVAGGVNLYLHPAKYQSLCRRRMLALDRRCRSYGAGDDGFVPGEGVGAVLLKPLRRAIADGDHIHGVIAASACEHSGRANGYSAPNPNSQAMLIERVLEEAGVSPEAIGYVEGHGTGTQLGDSLEVLSLTQAFGKGTPKKQFCPLGSLKANVGHAESAAGIAGVTKVLLQFRHREIVPSIHSEEINPDIDFAASPFFLPRAAMPWPAPEGQPRRALINGFGAGGMNACVVLEEYVAPVERAREAADDLPCLIVVSARDEVRLRERVGDLLAYLRGCEDACELSRLAYALQTGRETMEERLALVVADIAALLAELESYVAGAPSTSRWTGRVEAHRRKKSPKAETRRHAQALFAGGQLAELARLWTAGQDIEWEDFCADGRPHRLPLPTYPFARERYWATEGGADEGIARTVPAESPRSRLHPLVADNVSTLQGVVFTSRLDAAEYYGRDHRVNGEAFFPGAGFLEIACAAGAIAGEGAVRRIEDVVWARPLKLGAAPSTLRTQLRSNGDHVEYLILSYDEDQEPVHHSEGRLYFGERGRTGRHDDEPKLALSDLKARAEGVLSGPECYRRFAEFGFEYGPSFRSVQELHVGKDFVLSRLCLDAGLLEDFGQYILHPCMIDGALQTVVGFSVGGADATPYLPFALGSVDILRPLPEICYVHAEPASSDRFHSGIMKYRLRVLTGSGELVARLDDFYVRALRGASGDSGAPADAVEGVLPQ